MNIEEQIKIVKNILLHAETQLLDYEALAIETLLTAYEKEKEIVDKINKLNIPVDTLIAEFERLENLEDDRDMLKSELEKEKEKNNNVLGLIFEYGQTDGEHHKAWVIDQIVRIITENNYDKWVQHYEYDEETDEDYFWDVGIAP